jgi:S-adenosylmethionine synthetase
MRIVHRKAIYISESVTEGHPDKLCDQISDAIVDHLMAQDLHTRVRAESAVSGAIVFIAARFASEANIDFTRLARKVIGGIGYEQEDFNPRTCSILSTPHALPIEVAARFNEEELSEDEIDAIPSKEQVTVFGFACDQNDALMPYPPWIANQLTRRLAYVRKHKIMKNLLPDAKVQVGVEYQGRIPKRIHSITIVVHQNGKRAVKTETLTRKLRETVIGPVFSTLSLQPDKKTRINVNPDGPYLGGPTHHSGLTGRKNAVDTYGEYTRHSGKALSGKDLLRTDRIGAYAARHAAKNIVAAGLAAECEVVVSYAIGQTQPISLIVNTFDTGKIPEDRLNDLVSDLFDFRPVGILRAFRLRHLPRKEPRGFYQKLAAYGHFGRDDIDTPWEKADRVEDLVKASCSL